MVGRYLGVARRVPVYEARFPAGLDALPATVDAIESVVMAGNRISR
jgi:hypothetical protein